MTVSGADCEQSRVRILQEGKDGGDTGSSCCADCEFGATTIESVRIATWATVAPTLQAYADAYQLSNPEAARVRLTVLPSMQDLQVEAIFDLQVQTGLYDGFVVPPMFVGGLFEQEGLADLNDFTQQKDYVWKDLLPYYRNHVATFDGVVRTVPLFSGSQMLLFFRKDYLDSKKLPTPKTWGDFIRIAAALHGEPLGNNGEPIYGACIGRMSESACRERMDQTAGASCHSMSMTYLGLSLASMTQVGGNSTGWLFDTDPNAPNGIKALLTPTLERLLIFLEEQLKYGAPDELTKDDSLNLQLFQQGRCAMTISADHPEKLLRDKNVGFVPVPGAYQVLDRETEKIVECTKELCPYGNDFEDWGRVNSVPFGATDAVVGGVSALASETNQAVVKDFMQFVMSTRLNISVREQPMTYTGLEASTIPGYEKLLVALNSHENIAIPFRTPRAFQLLSDLDTKVYDYLVAGNFTDANREGVGKSVERAWEMMIENHDQRFHAIPMSVFYEKSLGTFTPEPAEDLYIGPVLRGVGWALGGISCLTSLIMALWVWKYQKERVVRASQPVFLWMLCGGTFVMAMSIFPFGIEDDISSERAVDAACMSAIWLYAFGCVTTFSALFSKMWRINRIFRHARNLQRIKVEPSDVLLPFLLLFGINFVVLLVWNIVDPYTWHREPVDGTSSSLNLVETSTYGYCDSDHARVYLGIILGTNLFVSFISLIQAYECRKISTEYSESLWISGALACIVQVWIIGLPVLRLVGDNPMVLFFVKTGIVFVTCMSTLLLLFVPKMRYLRVSLAERQHDQKRMAATTRISTSAEKDSNTDHHSQTSDDTHGKYRTSVPAMTMGNTRISGLEPPATDVKPTSKPQQQQQQQQHQEKSAGVVGIRVIQSSTRHSEEVERMQNNLDRAESRNKVLQDRLERLQEKLEQYIVTKGHGSHPSTWARQEQPRVSGTTEDSH